MTFQPIRPGNYTHSLRRRGEMEEYRDDPSGQQKCLQMGTKRKMLMAYLSGWMALRCCGIIIYHCEPTRIPVHLKNTKQTRSKPAIDNMKVLLQKTDWLTVDLSNSPVRLQVLFLYYITGCNAMMHFERVSNIILLLQPFNTTEKSTVLRRFTQQLHAYIFVNPSIHYLPLIWDWAAWAAV